MPGVDIAQISVNTVSVSYCDVLIVVHVNCFHVGTVSLV